MTDQLSQVSPVDLPAGLSVVAGGGNSTGSGVNFETVTQLRGRVASRLSADGLAFEQLDPASARVRIRAEAGSSCSKATPSADSRDATRPRSWVTVSKFTPEPVLLPPPATTDGPAGRSTGDTWLS